MEMDRNINMGCESITTIGGCGGNAAASPGTIGRIHGMLRGNRLRMRVPMDPGLEGQRGMRCWRGLIE